MDTLSSLSLSDPIDYTLRLPSELLDLIANHLPTPPTLASHLSHGVLQDTFEVPKLPATSSTSTASRPDSAARDLSSMRLVCRRWEAAARSVLFRRGKIKRVEELEFWCGLGRKKGLSSCVQRLDLLVQPFIEKASYDDDFPEPSLVLEDLLKACPALTQLSIQAPLPLTLFESLYIPEEDRFNSVELLVDLALVIQTTRWDDPDFASALSRHSRTLPIPAILPFLTLHRHLRSLHLGGCHLAPADVGLLLKGLSARGIKLETFSVELLLVEGKEWNDRLEVLKIAGKEMGGSLRSIRFAGAVEVGPILPEEDGFALLPTLRSFTRLECLNLGLRAAPLQSDILLYIARFLAQGCRTWRRGPGELAIVWETRGESGEWEESGWSPRDERGPLQRWGLDK